MLVLSIFPILFIKLSHLLGVDYPPSLLFLFGILFVVFVTFRQEGEISQLDERVKELAQRNALLEQVLGAYRAEEHLKQDNTQEDGK